MLAGATKDPGYNPPETDLQVDLIAGVRVRETRNVVTRNGVTTELYRVDWGVGSGVVEQAIRVSLRGGAVSAWHCHRFQTDHTFVTHGAMKLALFDDRDDSPTRGKVNVFHLGLERPMLVVIPPGVWHGFRNLLADDSVFVNLLDRAYCYADPDEWRLPADTAAIPYRI